MINRFSKIKLFLIASTVLFNTSCEDYLDINDDPNLPTSVPAHSRLVGAITTTNGSAMWRGSREVAAVTQYASTALTTGSNRNAETWRFTASYFFWQNAYVFTMPNSVDLIVLGEKEGNPHFVGAGKTLLALNLGMLTDQYGAIVVDDYYDGNSQINLTPTFNKQEEVYQRIQQLLDEAIIAFDNPKNKTPLNFSGGDIMYQGDVDKWRRFAWSLKARYMNHLSKKSSLYDAQKIIEAAQNGFNADGMDAEFAYLEGGQQTDENPWYSWGGFTNANPVNNRYFTWSQFFVSLLQNLPVTEADYQDPRISRIMQPAPSDGEYRGLKSGLGLAGGQGGTGQFTDVEDYGQFKNSGFYTRATSPFPFITYSEVKLIEAEARLRSNDASGALAAYEEGVKANMRKLGVPAAEINAYWAAQLENGVVDHFNNLTNGLSHIMRQKYITQTLNPETWVDMRRMDYSQEIYGPYLQRPANINTVVFNANDPNQWIQAMIYETNEQNRNGDQIGDNSAQYRLLTPLWWNTPE
ncbi:SusD/RagB family nutrient-binding outer membrane lipoprotein [Pontibacter anaerobius]|uniref:SusD/RagB family nutrient-binding outer membrane lipoprotein n=1 Tax=Pontibacter anaerobius TaxID=2993940 RepID=A0ABT3RFW7_9BACT|nr:SusD/RagB family nutrient-binding outer membrane lipoprotein [Pontibacter anaerobius]MCX2740373.1 SusD/RagB family nutrient-binding outer membrane lipoprotein [Pontibacter anaerobius]